MKKSLFKIFYIIYIVILLALIGVGLFWVYDCCDKYQKNSSETLIASVVEKLEKEKGITTTCDNVPSIDANGNTNYILRNEKTEIAKLTLKKTGNTLIVLPLLEIKDITPLRTYNIITTSQDNLFKVNDEDIDCSYIDYDYSTIPFFSQLNKSLYSFPDFYQTSISNVYDINEIVVDENKDLFKVNESTYILLNKLDSSKQEQVKEKAVHLIKKYSNYIGGELSKDEMLSYTQYYSPLNARLTLYKAFYTHHDSISLNDLEISDAYLLDNDYYLINAKYTFITVIDDDEIVDNTTLSLVLHDNGYSYSLSEISNYFYYDLKDFNKND